MTGEKVIDLRYLDFSRFNCSVDISHMIVSNNIYQECHRVGGSILQSKHYVIGNIFQYAQEAFDSIFQDLQIAHEKIIQDDLNKGE